jgi:hypothetical protein
MKKLYSLFAAAMMVATVNAQTTFFTENMGTATATTAITANTFQNGAPVAFSGTADIRATNVSDYSGASAGANVMVNANNETFLISGIDTSDYENITLSIGQRKGASAANNELKIEVSEDGATWTLLSYTRPTGTGTANWAVINPAGTIPTTETLSIRFTGTNATEWRIDDVKLTGTLIVLGTGNNNAVKANLVKNTVVANEIIFAAASDVKVISANGQVVRTASVKENSTLEISSLPAGIYIVTGNVNGNAVSQKIIKK